MQQEQPMHQVKCDECQRWPINGWRYRCGECRHSVCGACFPFTRHDPQHVFLVLRKPMDSQLEKTERLLIRAPLPGETKRARFDFGERPASTPLVFAFNPPAEEAPQLEHPKGPLFEKALDATRMPSDSSPFQLPPQTLAQSLARQTKAQEIARKMGEQVKKATEHRQSATRNSEEMAIDGGEQKRAPPSDIVGGFMFGHVDRSDGTPRIVTNQQNC